MKYIGFDLGDGESCLTLYDTEKPTVAPVEISIGGSASFPSVVGVNEAGEVFIGNLVTDEMQDVRACFKRDFCSQTEDVKLAYHRFVGGVIKVLKQNYFPDLEDTNKYQFVIGQPADWNEEVLEQFRKILIDCGISNPLLTSEPRAALVYFKSSNILGDVSHLLSASVLIVDFGSSTLDFAYVKDGNPDEAGVFGDPHLGGGLMDEEIVMESIRRMANGKQAKIMKTLMEEDKTRRSQLMLAARAMKETYFENEEEIMEESMDRVFPIFMKGISGFTLHLDQEMIHRVVMNSQPLLGGNSLYSQLQDQLRKAKRLTSDNPPQLVILTGGASRMQFFREMCTNTFQGKNTRIVFSKTPSYDISRGLCLSGRAEAQMQKLRIALKQYADGNGVEEIVEEGMSDLVEQLSNHMIEDAVPKIIQPKLNEWKKTKREVSLSTYNDSVVEAMQIYFGSQEYKKSMEDIIGAWSLGVFQKVQREIDAKCAEFGVDAKRLQLKNMSIQMERAAKGEVIQISSVLDVVIGIVITTLMGMVCGGTGTALIASGPVGVIIGMAIGVLGVLFGRNAVHNAVMNIKIPKTFRKLIRDSLVTSPRMICKMQKSLAEGLLEDEHFSDSLVTEVSAAIDQTITDAVTQKRLG